MLTIKLGSNKIFSGIDALEIVKDLVGSEDRVLIVESGTILQETGAEKKLLKQLEGIETKIFYDVNPDPSYEDIFKGSLIAKSFRPTLIIGFGGGSAMDAAKLIWVCYENEHIDTLQKLVTPESIRYLRNKTKLCCIPTTSGTGSEVTRAAVITDAKSKRKYAVVAPNLDLVPDYAILDVTLTESMPQALIASTGMDALTHSIESYISNKANIFSEVMSVASFELIMENLEEAYKTKSEKSLEKMQIASCLAGISFSNSGLGIVHSIAHTVGAKYHIPHGMANAILLPFALKFLKKDRYIEEKLKFLSKKTDNEDIIKSIEDLNRRIHIPESLSKVVDNWNESDLDMLTQLALDDVNTRNSLVKPTFSEMRKIIEEAFAV